MSRPFKVLRCRYFDEKGRPVKPFCSSGHNCGFVHPNDPQWPTAKYASDRTGVFERARLNNHPRTRSPSPDTRRRTSVNALPFQDDISRHLKVEKDSDDNLIRWDDDRGKVPEQEHRDPPAAGYAAPRPPYASRWDEPGSRHPQSPPSVSATSRTQPLTPQRPAPSDPSRSVRPQNNAAGPSQDKKNVERIVELFRLLTKATNETNEENALAEAEKRKVKTYTDMSASLSKISAPATAAVAPILAEVVANHKVHTERAESGYSKIGQIWTDIFGTVVDGIVNELNTAVDDALRRLQREGASIVADLVADGVAHEREKERERIRTEREQMRDEEDVAALVAGKRKPSLDLRPGRSGSYTDEERALRDNQHAARDKRRRLESPERSRVDISRTESRVPEVNQDMMLMMANMLRQMTSLGQAAAESPLPPRGYTPTRASNRPRDTLGQTTSTGYVTEPGNPSRKSSGYYDDYPAAYSGGHLMALSDSYTSIGTDGDSSMNDRRARRSDGEGSSSTATAIRPLAASSSTHLEYDASPYPPLHKEHY